MDEEIQPYRSLSPGSCAHARKLLGLSEEELAAAAQVSVSTLRRYEAGTLAPSAYVLRQLHKALVGKGAVFVGSGRAA